MGPAGVETWLIFVIDVVSIADEWFNTLLVIVVLGVVHFCGRCGRVFLSLLGPCVGFEYSWELASLSFLLFLDAPSNLLGRVKIGT